MRTYHFRCFHFRQGGETSAVCLDLALRVSGASPAAARARLEALISDYVSDFAETGSDPGTAVPRPAPPSEWADFYRRRLLHTLRRLVRADDGFAAFRVSVFHNGYLVPRQG